jgi:hypothetical protein
VQTRRRPSFSSQDWALARIREAVSRNRQRFSGFSYVRQWADDVLRVLVTGGQGDFGGGGIPQRIIVSSRSVPATNHRSRIVGEHTRHWRQVADVQHPEKSNDGGLICGDAVEIAH